MRLFLVSFLKLPVSRTTQKHELSWEVEHVQKKKLLQFGADGHLWRGVGFTGLNVYALRDSFLSAAVVSLTISDIYNTYLILLSEWTQSNKDSFRNWKWMKTWFCGIVQTILWSSNHVAETQRLIQTCARQPAEEQNKHRYEKEEWFKWLWVRNCWSTEFFHMTSVGFTENDLRRRKYPVGSSSLGENGFLMPEVKGEGSAASSW